jgi:hypothetical protein
MTAAVTAGTPSPTRCSARSKAKTLSKAIPDVKLRTLEGQTHDVLPDALAPVLVEFFGA